MLKKDCETHPAWSRPRRRAGAALALFLLALLSKPMAVSLPITLLLLDYCLPDESGEPPRPSEKIPFFALALLACAAAFWAQARGAAVVSTSDLPILYRLGGATRALAFYLGKTVFPTGLAPLYPWPSRSEVFAPAFFAAAALLSGITALCVLSRVKDRGCLAAWLYFLVSLVPVIGIVQVGSQFAADRYTYLPSLGPAVLAGAGVASLWERLEGFWKRAALTALIGGLLALLVLQTARQEAVWKDSLSLWTHEVRLYPREPATGHFKLGAAFKDLGRIEESAREFAAAAALSPDDAQARNNLGGAYARLGRVSEAAAQFQQAARLKPEDHEAANNIGAAYMEMGRFEEAAERFQASVGLKPGFPEGHYNLGTAYMRLGKTRQAVREYATAIGLRPEYREARNNLGQAYMRLGRFQDAATEYQALLGLSPDDPVTHYNLGVAYRKLGRAEAASEFREALKLNPDFPQARKALGEPLP